MDDGVRVRDRRERLLDDLARGLATELPRRRLLLLALGVAVGASLPGRARGATRRPEGEPCGGTSYVCGALNPLVVPGCCGLGSICCQFDDDFHCCDPERHRCGENRIGARPCDCLRPCGEDVPGVTPPDCCRADEECVQPYSCRKRCEPGAVRCGDILECCPVGASCIDGECQCPGKKPPCRGVCCARDEECDDGVCKATCKTETNRRASRLYNRETQCCTEYGIERKYPIQYLQRCEKTRVPRKGYEPTANGCGAKGGPKFPDTFGKASFLDACNRHDLCYGRCKSDRGACDKAFGKRLEKACTTAYPRPGKGREACLNEARTYYDGVRALGSFAYEAAQREACQCCP